MSASSFSSPSLSVPVDIDEAGDSGTQEFEVDHRAVTLNAWLWLSPSNLWMPSLGYTRLLIRVNNESDFVWVPSADYARHRAAIHADRHHKTYVVVKPRSGTLPQSYDVQSVRATTIPRGYALK